MMLHDALIALGISIIIISTLMIMACAIVYLATEKHQAFILLVPLLGLITIMVAQYV